MADEQGYIDTDKLAEFKPTMGLRRHMYKPPYLVAKNQGYYEVLQQKWTNELGDSEWRDIPLVISE